MRTALPSRRSLARHGGILLVECLVYCAVFFILGSVAFAAFYRGFDTMRGLRRNAEDVVRALHVGERWREDVRSATGLLALEEAGHEWRIPTRQGAVRYRFRDGTVDRQGGENAPWVALLPRVKTSDVIVDRRERVVVWRWELELQSSRQAVRVRPLFTFLAASQPAERP